MTLEEAIKHYKEQAEKHSDDDCGMEHKQLAEWLIELKHYRNVWKDHSQLPKKGKVVVACCNAWEDVICGEFKILELNIGNDTKTYRIDYLDWEYVVKWAYLKDVFPYRDSSILNYPIQFNETRGKCCSSLNGELASHKAWEESLLYADRIRGSF